MKMTGNLVLTALVFSAFHMAHAESPATDYDGIFYNEDSSVEIVVPRFNGPEEMNMRISDKTAPKTVCEKFGYSRFVPGTMEMGSGVQGENYVRLDEHGHFIQYDAATAEYHIHKLDCTNIQDGAGFNSSPNSSSQSSSTTEATSTSGNSGSTSNTSSTSSSSHESSGFVPAKISKNDDGTFWIAGFSAHFENQDLPISSYTDPNVICKRYGFGSFVANSLKILGSSTRVVRLGAEDRFTMFDAVGTPVIAELICNPQQ